MTDDNKIIDFPKKPTRVRPEMLIRNALANVDRIRDIVVVYTDQAGNPTIAASDRTNPYLLSMASAVLQDWALAALPGKKP